MQAAQVHVFSWHKTEHTVRYIAGYTAVGEPREYFSLSPELLFSRERLSWLHQKQPLQFQTGDLYLPPFLTKRLRQTGMNVALYIPIVVHESVVGFVELLEEFPHRVFTDSEMTLAQGM
ncbi:hypothetical protein V6O07_07335, partial [Arthrospira platensis SPKY2]